MYVDYLSKKHKMHAREDRSRHHRSSCAKRCNAIHPIYSPQGTHVNSQRTMSLLTLYYCPLRRKKPINYGNDSQ